MAAKIQAIRGMNDLLPSASPAWQFLETTFSRLLGRYGYQEIRMPILEETALFQRSIGDVTDIVEKEMYTFDDRNGTSLTLRPEGTAGCVRAAEQHGLLYNQQQRLWYQGPMFRYERPQKGRYRQFHQIGVETFGLAGPDIDAELILLSARLWQELGILEHLTLELNTLGSNAARAAYREDLSVYLTQFASQLDADSQRRLSTNPLRILDSKDPNTQKILQAAPKFDAYLDAPSQEHFNGLCGLLDAAGISYKLNPLLVRGLDYYNQTVFEWTTTALGAQGTVCAGGRYDGLVEQLGGKPTPAVGFALGVERLILLLETLEALPANLEQQVDVYLAALGEEAASHGLLLAERLRSEVPNLRVLTHCGGGGMRQVFRRADRSGAHLAIILGAEELQQGAASVKFLRSQAEQQTLPLGELAAFISEHLNAAQS